MLQEPRPIHFRTYIDTAREWPALFRIIPSTVLFAVVGVFLVFVIPSFDGGVQPVDEDNIRQNGIATEGIITDISSQNNVTINGKHPLIVSYSYSAKGTETNSKYRTLDVDVVDKMNVGDKVQVMYLEKDSIITTLTQFNTMWLSLMFPVIFFGFGLGPLLILSYLVSKKIRLFKYGVVKTAEILSVTRESPGYRIFFKPVLMSRVDYQYKDLMGRTCVQSAKSTDLILSNGLKNGDTIKIFVSPDDGSKSTLISRRDAVRNQWKID